MFYKCCLEFVTPTSVFSANDNVKDNDKLYTAAVDRTRPDDANRTGLQPGCMVSPLVWANFFGQNVDLTSGPHCSAKSAIVPIFWRSHRRHYKRYALCKQNEMPKIPIYFLNLTFSDDNIFAHNYKNPSHDMCTCPAEKVDDLSTSPISSRQKLKLDIVHMYENLTTLTCV